MQEPTLHIVLHQPEIPHNAGAVGRTCVALGAKLWLVRPLGFRVDDRHLRRAGLDYWEHLDWEVVDDWIELNARLSERKWWYFSKKADRLYTDALYRQGDVLIFGCESQGLPDSMLASESCLQIPVRSEARSLNLSVSVSIVGFEAQRQWSNNPTASND